MKRLDEFLSALLQGSVLFLVGCVFVAQTVEAAPVNLRAACESLQMTHTLLQIQVMGVNVTPQVRGDLYVAINELRQAADHIGCRL